MPQIAVKSVADLPFTNESKFLLSELPDSAWSLSQYSLIILTFGKQMRAFQLIPPFFWVTNWKFSPTLQ